MVNSQNVKNYTLITLMLLWEKYYLMIEDNAARIYRM